MRKLKDVQKIVREGRPKTNYERALHQKRLRERRNSKARLRQAQAPFKDKDTKQTNFELERGRSK
jgi:hypothetical protein